jgi:hypothetical protein
MDTEECYAWGKLFARDREALVAGMAERARAMGLDQQVRGETLVWNRGTEEDCRWVFVPDPANIERVRDVFSDDGNVNSPSCFVVVTQPDESDTRGDAIFDIFRLSPKSYLWHFHRVYTRPKESTGSHD